MFNIEIINECLVGVLKDRSSRVEASEMPLNWMWGSMHHPSIA